MHVYGWQVGAIIAGTIMAICSVIVVYAFYLHFCVNAGSGDNIIGYIMWFRLAMGAGN